MHFCKICKHVIVPAMFIKSFFTVEKWRLLIELMRLDKPVGIFLLMWPCWIGTAVETRGNPKWELLLLFAIGSVIMRSAGCIINDIADRKLDAAVERTRNRPLASGGLSLTEALVVLFLLLISGIIILLFLRHETRLLGFMAIIPVIIYPFMKRITNWPQLFLGITFNWGILLASMEIHGRIMPSSVFLYVAFIFWTLGYDTIYAIQDMKDDVNAGIKSSAITLGRNLKTGISWFYALFGIFLLIALFLSGFGINAIFPVIFVLMHLRWQLNNLNINSANDALTKFKSNQVLGFMIFALLLII